MRDGLKKRIAPKTTGTKKNINTFKKYNVVYKSKKYQKNVNPSKESCKYDAACEKGESKLTRRRYYAPFRQPILGKRYEGKNNVSFIRDNNDNKPSKCADIINGNDTSNKVECLWTQVPTDGYDTCNMTGSSRFVYCANGTKPTTKFPDTTNTDVTYSGNYVRTNRPIIRSGMQPNTAGQQNSGFYDKRKTYSYSYNELIRRRRKDTYVAQLPDYNSSSGKGNQVVCCSKTKKEPIRGNYSNDKFKVQGAVESSSRIDRLKLDTLRATNNKCSTNCSDVNKLGARSGLYFAGKSRFNSIKQNVNTKNSSTDVTNALTRVRGNVSSISNSENRKCCDPTNMGRQKSTKC